MKAAKPRSSNIQPHGQRGLASSSHLHDVNDRVAALTADYGSDAAVGVVYDEERGASVLPDGRSAVSCSDYAYYIRSLQPHTAIYGFWSKENPSWAGAALLQGHDFAVVEDRYIVDPWMVETEALSKRSIHDLENPAHAAEITRLYGNRLKWTLVESPSTVRHSEGPASTFLNASCVITEGQFLHSEFDEPRKRPAR